MSWVAIRPGDPPHPALSSELLGPYCATRTTLKDGALPTPIADELKLIARAP